ncbi:MAG TPA: hypothetical protein VFJ10_13170 [Acidobacteriaceae bacterium]|nr:hypothetical protein [Acidobacteriaceae bacterium]
MDPQQAQAMHAAMAMLAIMPIFILIFSVIVIIPMWFIWKKAGFSPWLSILSIIPAVNLIMLYVLAFSQWKVVPVNQPLAQATYPRV